MEFPRQEHWSGLPLPPPGHLLDPELEPMSSALTGRFFTTEPPGKPYKSIEDAILWVGSGSFQAFTVF